MTKLLLAAFMAVLALAACGGGGGVPEVPVAPAPPPPPTFDITFTQITTSQVVTPGETFSPVLIAVTCPLQEGVQACRKSMPLGEVDFTFDLPLQDVKLVQDGVLTVGFFTQDMNKYRFVPTGYNPMWKPGTLEVKATLSPTAKDGAKTAVVIRAANASLDTTLNVVPSESSVTVKALPYHAPAVVSSLKDGNGLTYFCPSTVVGGCRLDTFDIAVNGTVAGGEVQLDVEGAFWGQFWADNTGYLYVMTGVGYTVPSGGAIVVHVLTKPGPLGAATMWYQNFKSWSGDTQIAPVVLNF